MEAIELNRSGDIDNNLLNNEPKFKEEKQINGDYTIKLGEKENQNELVIRVIPEEKKEILYYQQSFKINQIHKLCKEFTIYKTVDKIIEIMIGFIFEVEIKDNDLVLKFNISTIDHKKELKTLNLKCNHRELKYIINNLFQSIKNSEEKNKQDISKLNEKISELEKNISLLKNDKIILIGIISFLSIFICVLLVYNHKNNDELQKRDIIKKEISNLNEKYELLLEKYEILRKIPEISEQLNNYENLKKSFDSTIVGQIDSIDFIFNHIRKYDKLLKINNISLLYRGSTDGDDTITCHELCDNKQNVLIIIKSNADYIFGGYSKIGFKTINNLLGGDVKSDDNSFLFSKNLTKIYPVNKGKKVIHHTDNKYGLCFYDSLSFSDNYMEKNNSFGFSIQEKFNEFNNEFEMNGGSKYFTIKELEVFQLL